MRLDIFYRFLLKTNYSSFALFGVASTIESDVQFKLKVRYIIITKKLKKLNIYGKKKFVEYTH